MSAARRATPAEKAVRAMKTYLRELTRNVDGFLALLDAEMKKPSTEERGQTIARLSNELEMANDVARHFGLDEKFPLKKASR